VLSVQRLIETELLPFVEKPMRYVGNEVNIIRKDPAATQLAGVLCFPDTYEIGMSHYGSQILYHIVNAHAGWTLARAYLPWPDAHARMTGQGIPLYDLEYLRPLNQADWLGFSLQYELQYANVLAMLDLAGIPLRSAERDSRHPVVIAGGPCVYNPEPLADFIDAFVVGDGEESVVALCCLLERMKSEKMSRAQTLTQLGTLAGVYVPSVYPLKQSGRFFVADIGPAGPVAATKVAQLHDKDTPVNQLVPLMEVVHHRLAVEVMRGCTRGCRFCSAGIYYRPVRERRPESIAGQIKKSIAATGWRDVGLLSLSTADYQGLGSLLSAVSQLRRSLHISVSLPSTRIDALSGDDLREINAVSPASSFTIAPEAGSDRLRRTINKDFTDETILSMARQLLANNIQTLKLYFMIGLPTETDEDIAAMIRLINAIADLTWNASRRRMVHVSLSPFSPKPHTPFQWEAMDTVESLAAKSAAVRAALRHRKNVKLSIRNPQITLLETVFARGDRRVGELIHTAWRRGAKLDGWDEWFDFSRWQAAAAQIGCDLDAYTTGIDESQALPWQVVSTGVSREFLLAERAKALQAVPTADCRTHGCSDCGVCGAIGHDLMVKAPPPPQSPDERVAGEAPSPLKAQPRYYYRFMYSRGPNIRFLPHLDMVSCIHRALCAANMPMAYSEGFHPHPRIAFGPPLPRGMSGTAELFDVQTVTAIDPTDLAANRWLPEGLRIEHGWLCPSKPAPLNAAIIAGRFRFQPLTLMSAAEIEAGVNLFCQSETLSVTIERKGQPVTRDLKPLIYAIHPVNIGANAGFEALLSMLPGKTCRGDELLAALFPRGRYTDFIVTRVGCMVQTDQPEGGYTEILPP
jgi:radical SAM family uncharacterized protein/radical SAM-linked protein